MMKRIICLILTVVMLTLTLVGCGYNYTKDDLSQYATFDKAALESAISALVIEDGDFTEDATIRAQKLIDKIYDTLAGASGTDAKTDGVIGEHDVFKYCYYVTYTDGEKTIQLVPTYMETGKAVKILMGKQFTTDFEKALLSKMAGFDFTNKAYTTLTSGKAEDGQVAFITYTYSYDKTVDGKLTTVTDTVTLERVIIDKEDALHKGILFKPAVNDSGENGGESSVSDVYIGNTAPDFDIEGGYTIAGEFIDSKIKITKAKIDYAIKVGIEPISPIVETTYTEKTELTNVYGDKVDLKDKELTYHIYPVSYIKTLELNATNLIESVFGKNVNSSLIKTLLFGVSFSTKTEAEQKALVDAKTYTISGVSISLEDFVTSLVDAISKQASAKTTYDTAKDDLQKAEDDLSTKKTNAEKEGATEADKSSYEAAKEKVATYKKALETAKTELEKANDTRDEKIAVLLTNDEAVAKAFVAAENEYDAAVLAEADAKTKAEAEGATQADKDAYTAAKTTTQQKKSALDTAEANLATAAKSVNDTMVASYKDSVYVDLQNAYRQEIKINIATEVYNAIKTLVKLTSVPAKAQKEAFNQMMENYEYAFYNNKSLDSNSSSSSTETFYARYEGSFRTFLVDYAVPTDIGTSVKNYDEAIAAMKNQAAEYVKPVLQIYIVAEAFGLTFTDAEFKEYKKNNSSYTYNEAVYGENTVRNAAQFDKLLDYFLTSEEKSEEGNEIHKWDNYTVVKYTIADEESEDK